MSILNKYKLRKNMSMQMKLILRKEQLEKAKVNHVQLRENFKNLKMISKESIKQKLGSGYNIEKNISRC